MLQILFLGLSLCSILASAMFMYAMVILAQATFASQTIAASIFNSIMGAQLLLTPVAGALIDQQSRRRVLLLSHGTLAAVVGSFAVRCLVPTGALTIGGLLPYTVLFGALLAFVMTVRLAIVRDLMPTTQAEGMMVKLALVTAVGNGSGPALVGLLREVGGWPAVFFGSFGLLLASGGLALFLPACATTVAGLPVGWRGQWGHLQAGYGYAWSHPRVWQLLALVALTAFCLMGPYNILMPDYARYTLGLDESARGTFLGSIALFFLLGGVASRVLQRRTRWGPPLVGHVALGGGALVLLATTRHFWLALGGLGLLGIAGSVAWSLTLAALQSTTEVTFTGRVMGLYVMIQQACTVLGGWCFSLVADASSTPSALALAGSMLVLGCAGQAFRCRALWQLQPAVPTAAYPAAPARTGCRRRL